MVVSGCAGNSRKIINKMQKRPKKDHWISIALGGTSGILDRLNVLRPRSGSCWANSPKIRQKPTLHLSNILENFV